MKHFKTLSAAALAGTMAFATSAFADTAPDLRGEWSGTHTVVGLPNKDSDGAARFTQSEWVIDIQEQQDNVFWGTSKWSREGSDTWREAQVTGSIRMDGSGTISMVETRDGKGNKVNALIDATIEDGKIFADVRSLRSGISYSTVMERDSTS